jgi:hypothetical protein
MIVSIISEIGYTIYVTIGYTKFGWDLLFHKFLCINDLIYITLTFDPSHKRRM